MLTPHLEPRGKVPVPRRHGHAPAPPAQGSWRSYDFLLLFNGVIGGTVGAYVATGSFAVALLAVTMAVAFAGWLGYLQAQR